MVKLAQNLSLLDLGKNKQKSEYDTEEYKKMTKQIVNSIIEKKTKKILEDDIENKSQKKVTSKFKEEVRPSIKITTNNDENQKDSIIDISTASKKISDRIHRVISGRSLLNDEEILANFDLTTKRVSEKKEETVVASEKVSKKSKERDLKMEMKRKYAFEKEMSKLEVS